MDVSRFILDRLTAPAPARDDPAGARDLALRVSRIERAVRVLYEVEKQRLEDNGAGEAWAALVRRAEARVAEEEGLG